MTAADKEDKGSHTFRAVATDLLLVGVLIVVGCGTSSGSGEQAKQNQNAKTTRQPAVGESADFADRTVTVHAVPMPATTPETIKQARKVVCVRRRRGAR